MDTATQAQVALITTMISSVLTLLGVTGLDAGLIRGAVEGVFAIIAVVAAIWGYFQHRKVLGAARISGARV